MAVSVNTVILSGNLTRDLELRYTPSGTAVTDMRIAVNRRVKRGDSWEDDTAFIDVTVWGRQAENCSQYLSKGRPVLVEGQLKMDEWEDRNSGQKRSKLSVVAQRVHFLGSPSGSGGRDAPPRRSEPQVEYRDEAPSMEDDLPF